jgi:6-phosphogluconolactonase
MIDRRHATILLGASLAAPAWADAAALPFYSAVGPVLSWYHFQTRDGALAKTGSITLPANVQYAWPDPMRRILYVAVGIFVPGGAGSGHAVQALRVGADGALTPYGAPMPLRQRAVHITVDPSGRFLLVAYNAPANISVHHIQPDGLLGAEVPQGSLDTGIYAHQVRVTPGGKTAVLVTRGNDPTATTAEDPGAIKVFGFQDGVLTNRQSLAPHGNGIGFGPRHLDFGGNQVFVSLERENSLCVYGLNSDGTFSAEPQAIVSTLTDPGAKAKYPGQTAGPVHVHPKGGFVYQTNRGSGTVLRDGRKVWNGGLNDIVVWKIDPAGAPRRIQNIDAHGFETRTFSITPDGNWLVAASQLGLDVAQGASVSHVSAGLAVYRIGVDGKLTFAHKTDVDTSAGMQFWSGFLTMP